MTYHRNHVRIDCLRGQRFRKQLLIRKIKLETKTKKKNVRSRQHFHKRSLMVNFFNTRTHGVFLCVSLFQKFDFLL